MIIFDFAGYGRKEAAELLLAAGAKPDPPNSDGQTPLQVKNNDLYLKAATASFIMHTASVVCSALMPGCASELCEM